MSYYPSSQIKTNLYTNGEEYILSTTKEIYKGNYYELSSGKKYTGTSPNNKPNILLTEIIIYPNSNGEFNEGEAESRGISFSNPPIISTTPYNNKKIPIRFLPVYNPTIPTPKDYNLGVFTRYFCKKNNELKYIEIDEKTYNLLKLKSNQLAWDLYTPLLVLWYLNGEKEKVFQTNKGLVNLIEKQNKWYGFSQYFKDNYTKYYLES
jgi:hypothetical protein